MMSGTNSGSKGLLDIPQATRATEQPAFVARSPRPLDDSPDLFTAEAAACAKPPRLDLQLVTYVTSHVVSQRCLVTARKSLCDSNCPVYACTPEGYQGTDAAQRTSNPSRKFTQRACPFDTSAGAPLFRASIATQ